MNIPGHIAVALAEHHYLGRMSWPGRQARVLGGLLLASLFPDVVDKTIGYVFHAMPNGRHYAHNLFSLVGLSLGVTLVWGRSLGLAWFLGYLGHLLADSTTRVPWFFPAVKYQFHKTEMRFEPTQLIREMIFLALVLAIRWTDRRG
jgi:hypothetical protein